MQNSSFSTAQFNIPWRAFNLPDVLSFTPFITLLEIKIMFVSLHLLSLNLEEIKKQGSRRVVSGFSNDHFRGTTTKLKKANKIPLLKSLLRYFNLEKNEEKKD